MYLSNVDRMNYEGCTNYEQVLCRLNILLTR
jgi:hypothetical protein